MSDNEYPQMMGYHVERLPAAATMRPHTDAYLLHGPRVTYRLRRATPDTRVLYAVNSAGNVCSVKGNYHFTDATGALHVYYR